MPGPAPQTKPKRSRSSGRDVAFGRSLTDFGELFPAEKTLHDCCRLGKFAAVGESLPLEETDENRVRSDFLRFLALGGDSSAPVHEHGIRLRGAWLVGSLNFKGATVQAYLILRDCRLDRLEAQDSRLKNLILDGSVIAGALIGEGLICTADFSLCHGFRSTGGVQLTAARIGGDLSFNGGSFLNEGGQAICLSRVQVEGSLFFRSVKLVQGDIDVSGAHASVLCDDFESWAYSAGHVILDGFTYGRIIAAFTDGATRIRWLGLQWPAHLGEDFKPQPWEQLIAVLRGTGNPEDARTIAIAKQDRLRSSGKIVRGAWTLHWLYGLLVGYGYRPMRLLAATASVWLICAAAYWAATNPAWFGAESHFLAPPPTVSGRATSAPDYRNFVPLIYSADVLLPVVDLGYKEEWQPVVADAQGNPLVWGQALRFLYWFEIAFGWIAGLLLVGVLGNLIKKD